MSVWYGLQGTIKVRIGPDVERIVAEFNDLAREITADLDDHGDGTATIEFSGGVFCSFTTVGEIDAKAQELGPYTIDPALLAYDCDGERAELPIGSGDEPTTTGKLIVVEVSGGVVQAVYCDDRAARIVLVDWDAEGCTAADPGIVEIIDSLGRSAPVHVGEFPMMPTATMPPETRRAVERAS